MKSDHSITLDVYHSFLACLMRQFEPSNENWFFEQVNEKDKDRMMYDCEMFLSKTENLILYKNMNPHTIKETLPSIIGNDFALARNGLSNSFTDGTFKPGIGLEVDRIARSFGPIKLIKEGPVIRIVRC